MAFQEKSRVITDCHLIRMILENLQKKKDLNMKQQHQYTHYKLRGSKEQISHIVHLNFGFGMKCTQIEQFAICPESYRDSITVVTVLSLKASASMAENIMLNKVGAGTHPCLTPLVTKIGSEDSPSSWTLTCIPSWNECTSAMNLSGQPNFAIIFHRPSQLTVSNPLVRSDMTCVLSCSLKWSTKDKKLPGGPPTWRCFQAPAWTYLIHNEAHIH